MTPTRAATTPRVIIRDAHRRDHNAIRRVVRAAYAQYAEVLEPELFSRYLADLLDLDRHADHGRLLVAEFAGRVRGSGAFYPDASVQGLGWPRGWAGGRGLAVHPGGRRHGVAQAMLVASEELARRAGSPVFAFHTASFMTGAVALYDGLGYDRVPDYDRDLSSHFGMPGTTPIRALAYRRVLAPDEQVGIVTAPGPLPAASSWEGARR